MALKLRLSYSLLKAWERGDVDLAVDTYFHVKKGLSPALEYGIKFHEDMADYIDKHNAFPDWFFNKALLIPETEKEVTVNYNELFDIKGIYDCLDGTDLFEFKTGVQPSSVWARSGQLSLYFLLAEISQIEVKRAFVIRHNQHENTTDFSIVHNTKDKREKARNMIDSYGVEIYNYFESQGLLYEKK